MSVRPQSALAGVVGKKTAEALLASAAGRDERVLTVIPEVHSVGVQLSYGVRCKEKEDVLRIVSSLCKVVVAPTLNARCWRRSSRKLE